jgi:hypothetical protein
VTSMSLERLYIYRCGATNACALTDEKGDSRLPASVAPDRWQFWMHTSRHPTEDGLHGFAMETALTQIAKRGFYLFTGSARLLATRVLPRAETPPVSIIATGTDTSITAP